MTLRKSWKYTAGRPRANLARNKKRISGSIRRSNSPMDAGIAFVIRRDSERFWGFIRGFMGILTHEYPYGNYTIILIEIHKRKRT